MLTSTLMEQASTYAVEIDNLILLITVIVGIWFVLSEGVFFYFILKFRRKNGQKAQYITGTEKHQTRWITVPHMLVLGCDILIIIGAVMVWVNVKQTLPEADRTVRVIAQQWAWTFVHPGPDEKIDTADDIILVDELHITEGLNYHFKLSAKDVVHGFSVPAFRLKQDAIPGREITGWFQATKPGQYDIQCAEMCGIGHGLMPAKLFVETTADHAKWLTENG